MEHLVKIDGKFCNISIAIISTVVLKPSTKVGGPLFNICFWKTAHKTLHLLQVFNVRGTLLGVSHLAAFAIGSYEASGKFSQIPS